MATQKSKRRKIKPDLRPVADGELARLRTLLAKKQEYVAILELELFNTRADLNEFSVLYNLHISPIQQRVNQLRKTLYDALEERRNSQQEDQAPSPEYPHRKNGNHAQAELPEDDPKRYRKTPRSRSQDANKPSRDPKIEEQIRELFRQLAKRFHPDLTSDPEEKKWREQIMTQVNQAYTARDLQALMALADKPGLNGSKLKLSKAKEIAGTKTELKRLDGVITQLEKSIKQIDVSPIMQLRLEVTMARRDDHDLLHDMVSELKIQVIDLEEHLVTLGVDIDTLTPDKETQ